MIARYWTGLIKKEKAEVYSSYFQQHSLKSLAAIDGFIRATVFTRDLPEGVEFMVITEWESLEAIRQFAGAVYDNAVVSPVVEDMMIRYDSKVLHYKVEFSSR